MKRILVIDDEADMTFSLKHLLESTGEYTVREENVSTNALATAREYQPDLIVLDVMMPDMDGSELAAQFLGDDLIRRVPIIFVTALVSNAETGVGTWCSSGGRTYLPKSTDLDVLVECIEFKLREQQSGAASTASPGSVSM